MAHFKALREATGVPYVRVRVRVRDRVRAGNRHLLEHGGAHVNVYREAKVLDDCAQLLCRDLAALVRSTTQRDERVHCEAAQPERVRDHATDDLWEVRGVRCGPTAPVSLSSSMPAVLVFCEEITFRNSEKSAERRHGEVRQRPRQRCLMRRTDLSTSIGVDLSDHVKELLVRRILAHGCHGEIHRSSTDTSTGVRGGWRTLQSCPKLPRIDGAAVILVEAGEGFAARFDLLVGEGHPHSEAEAPAGATLSAQRARAERQETFQTG